MMQDVAALKGEWATSAYVGARRGLTLRAGLALVVALAAGTYTIDVSGPIAAVSPPVQIAGAPRVYAGALANALNFYQNERDGPNYIPTPLRSAPGHITRPMSEQGHRRRGKPPHLLQPLRGVRGRGPRVNIPLLLRQSPPVAR